MVSYSFVAGLLCLLLILFLLINSQNLTVSKLTFEGIMIIAIVVFDLLAELWLSAALWTVLLGWRMWVLGRTRDHK